LSDGLGEARCRSCATIDSGLQLRNERAAEVLERLETARAYCLLRDLAGGDRGFQSTPMQRRPLPGSDREKDSPAISANMKEFVDPRHTNR
jgi:hypothetical protein